MTLLRMTTVLAVLFCCNAAIAQQSASQSYKFSVLNADLGMQSPFNAAPQTQNNTYNARLNSNGLISGRLQMKYPTGKTAPANATIQFSQNGQVINTARTDTAGQFATAGLRPGSYSANVAVGANSANIPVEVLNFDPNAKPEVIEGTLTPMPQGDLAISSGCNCGAPAVAAAPIIESAPIETLVAAVSYTHLTLPTICSV